MNKKFCKIMDREFVDGAESLLPVTFERSDGIRPIEEPIGTEEMGYVPKPLYPENSAYVVAVNGAKVSMAAGHIAFNATKMGL